jgi:hypothetical protein
MTALPRHGKWLLGTLSLVFAGALTPGAARGQAGQPEPDFTRPSLLENAWTAVLRADESAPATRVPRVRLFHMPAGFLSEPVGLDSGDSPPDPTTLPPPPDPGFLQVTMGMDNPFFDYRRPDDPGGVGYYKVDSQVQLLDKGNTCLCVGLQAVTPAGLESGGLADGPTVLRPAVAVFQELGDAAALHGFVAGQIRTHAGWTDELESGIQYGMAVQCAVPGLCNGPRQGVHVFVEALGRYRGETTDPSPARPMTWEIIPGVHWRVGERWWVSVGAARTSLLTCCWRY